MTEPLVSVIIPTYNRAHSLETSVGSILDQTTTDIELIVVDDGSNDQTAKLIAHLNDGRIHYIGLSKNRGASAARNIGIAHARGQYIAFQDSDDEWLPHKLEKQLPLFEQFPQRRGVVYCKYQRIDRGVPKRIFGEPFNRETLLYRNFVGTPTMVVHKDCLDVERFDEKLHRRQDWELCLRLMQDYPFGFVPEVLVLSHVSGESISHSAGLLEAYEYILTKHLELIGESRRALAECHYKMGILSIQEAQWKRGRSYLIQAIRNWPFDGRYWGRLTALLMGRSAYKALAKWRS